MRPHRLLVSLSLLLSLTCQTVRASDWYTKQEPEEKTKLFLWKATHDKQTIYLLGTIHVARPEFYPLPGPVDLALSESKCLAVEAATDRMDHAKLLQLVKSKITYPKGDDLSKHISPETRKAFDKYLTWAGEPFDLYREYRPWVISVLLDSEALKRMGFKSDIGLDRYLMAKARESKKDVVELESAQSQLDLMFNESDEEQDKMLCAAASGIEKLPDRITKIEDLWRAGDAEGMEASIVGGAKDNPEALKVIDKLITKRNAGMVEKMEKVLPAEGTSLVAVGSAHMLGEQGLPSLLAKKGYTVTQVELPEPMRPLGSVSHSAKKLQKQYYPEGRFSVALPGTPESKASNMAGLRSVDYIYPEVGGVYQVSYVVFPSAPANPLIMQKLYPAITASLVQKGNLKVISQGPCNVLNYSGWQINACGTGNPPAKPGAKPSSATPATPTDVAMQLRMFLAGRYLYVIGGTGKLPWLRSACVSDYLSSLEVRPEPSPYEQARRAQEQSALHSKEEADARHREFEQRFQEAQSNNRKAFEKSQADFKYRRNH